MSTTVTYKGQTLTTVENQTKTLQTAGTWVEGDFTLTDVTASGGGNELYHLINGSITDAEIDWSKVTTPKAGAFWGCSQITSVDNPTFYEFPQNIFRNCANLTKIEVSVTSLAPRYEGDVMRDNPKLTEATIHFLYSQKPNNFVTIAGNYFFANDPLLTTVIFDVVYANFSFANGWFFYNTPLLRNLVIKCKTVAAVSSGITSSHGWGGIYDNPTESTIWVPQALVESYKTATNWSTLYDAGVTFAPIEGSIYE